LAAVPAHDSLHGREANPMALEFLGRMKTLEYAEQLSSF
jgi:hypothetical protein